MKDLHRRLRFYFLSEANSIYIGRGTPGNELLEELSTKFPKKSAGFEIRLNDLPILDSTRQILIRERVFLSLVKLLPVVCCLPE